MAHYRNWNTTGGQDKKYAELYISGNNSIQTDITFRNKRFTDKYRVPRVLENLIRLPSENNFFLGEENSFFSTKKMCSTDIVSRVTAWQYSGNVISIPSSNCLSSVRPRIYNCYMTQTRY